MKEELFAKIDKAVANAKTVAEQKEIQRRLIKMLYILTNEVTAD